MNGTEHKLNEGTGLTKKLLKQARARGRQRSQERVEIEAAAMQDLAEYHKERAEVGVNDPFMNEGQATALRCLREVATATEQLEYLRQELLAILLTNRQHQTERPPELGGLARDLGELATGLRLAREE